MTDRAATANTLYNSVEAARRDLQRESEKFATDLSVIGVTAEQRQAKVARFEAIHKTGLPYQVVTGLFALDCEADLAEHRGVVFDEAVGREQADEVRRQVVGLYGPERGEDLIARTEKFVASFPELAKVLKRRDLATRRSGRPNDPASAFRKLVEHVHETDFR